MTTSFAISLNTYMCAISHTWATDTDQSLFLLFCRVVLIKSNHSLQLVISCHRDKEVLLLSTAVGKDQDCETFYTYIQRRENLEVPTLSLV